VRSSSTGELLGKPWVTFMVDAYSRRLLAVYLTFEVVLQKFLSSSKLTV
jgi:putative transposase